MIFFIKFLGMNLKAKYVFENMKNLIKNIIKFREKIEKSVYCKLLNSINNVLKQKYRIKKYGMIKII